MTMIDAIDKVQRLQKGKRATLLVNLSEVGKCSTTHRFIHALDLDNMAVTLFDCDTHGWDCDKVTYNKGLGHIVVYLRRFVRGEASF